MTDRPLDLDDLYDLRRVGHPVVSPDGERVAFLAGEADEDADAWHYSLFVAPADGNREPHRLTRVSGGGSPKWSPDGTELAFVAARDEDPDLDFERADGPPSDAERADGNGDEGATDGEGPAEDDEEPTAVGDGEDRPQVWAFDLERGGDARQLTDFAEGVSEFDWGPEGDRLVVAARDPTDDQREYLESRREDDAPFETERLQYKFDGHGKLDSVATYLFVVDRETGVATRLDDAYGAGALEPLTGLSPAWSPDGERIAFLSNRTERPDDSGAMDAFTVTPEGEDLRRLTDGDWLLKGLAWGPDGEQLALAGRLADNWYGTTELLVADAEDGDPTRVTASFDRSLSWVGMARWLDGDTLLAPCAEESRTRLVRLSTAGEVERVYDRQPADRVIAGFEATAETTALVLTGPDEPPELYAVPTENLDADGEDPARRLTDLNADFRATYRLPTCERVTFENSDGEDIDAVAYLPADFDVRDPEECPLIVNVHGGPMAFDAPSFGFDESYWTGEGYAVLQVNYRGSSSYGQAFSEQVRGEWGPREADDLVSGARELVARGWADPDRLFITGFSKGGTYTFYVITRTDEFAAAAPEHANHDFAGVYGTVDNQLWYESDLGLPWEDPERYAEVSNVGDVTEVDTPTLVTGGEADARCPPWQAEQLYSRLKKLGVPSKLVLYPDEHHAISTPERAIHRLRTLTDWFERHDPAVEN